MKLKTVILYLFFLPLLAPGTSGSRDVAAMRQKISRIESNGRSAHPGEVRTNFTEQEVNAYLASNDVRLPAGVQSVRLQGQAGAITGDAHVDFDRIREGIRSSNPLLSVFSGIHEVVVVTHAGGEAGRGHVHVDSVSLDDIEVPRLLLQLFVEKFLQPKYPDMGLDSEFKLPDRIDSATVGQHELSIIQK